MKEKLKDYDVKKGGYLLFMNAEDDNDVKSMKCNIIDEFIGKPISVQTISGLSLDRKEEFSNVIRVNGILEKNPNNNQYRILTGGINDAKSYSYFELKNVVELGCYGENKLFKDGSYAILGLKFE